MAFLIELARKRIAGTSKVKHKGKKMASEKLKKKETSARISEALARSGRKAKEVAASLGVSEVTMSKYVNGVSTPKNDYLIALARELNVSVSWLLGGDDEIMPQDGEPSYAEWKRRALEAEKKLEVLRGVIPMINEVNNILTKNF